MSVSNDLTKGSISKQLVRFSAPLVLSSLLQAVYGMADMVVAGRFIGPVGLSAVNNSSMIMLFITQIMMGVSTGGNILIGQYFGAGEKENCKQSVVTLFAFSMALGAALLVIFSVFSRPIVLLLDAPAPDEAARYLLICAFGVIFVAGYNATSAALRSVGNSKAPLICVAASCCLNIVLDIVFVARLGWGVAGTATATVISQGVSFFVSLFIVLRNYEVFGLRLSKLYIRSEKLRKLLRLGIPVCVQMSLTYISWLTVMYAINGHGVVVSAGNGISIKIKNFCQLFIMAMASGATAMIAQNVGAGEYDRARKVLYTAMRIAFCVSVVMIAAVEIFAPQLASLFTPDEATAAAAVRNLRIEIINQVFYSSLLIYHSLALGAGHTWYVSVSSFVNCILARVVLIFILNHLIGLTGIYIACLIAPATSVPIGIWYERSNRWRKPRVRVCN
ncbi:MAG: MATE family efflux transporter [Oscillospiraceae bacterium]|jgi:putative MATE family efflux protein|nr:MATE family efflux transporter [Oscillospiraceae bacterium]